ncbi:MAG: TolB family protein, partial [Flavobacteriales bacterium]
IAYVNNAKNEIANSKEKDISIKNMGELINGEYDFSPVVSLDEGVLFYTSRRLRSDSSNFEYRVPTDGKYYEDIYVSYRDLEGNWKASHRVSFENEDIDENEATISVSADGTTVYVYHDDEGDGNIYFANALDTTFSALEKLSGDINSKAHEAHCTITPDGSVMYFVSDRPGGIGGRDIYRVVKMANGEWSAAYCLPAPINTPFDEDAPFIHPTGKLLYFSSNGNGSMGGFDIFFSRLDSADTFTKPVNIGYPINTVDDDVFFVTNASGKRAYYSSSHEGGFGGKDIYMVELELTVAEPFAILKGYIRVPNGEQLPEDLVIMVSDLTIGGDAHEYRPRKADGGFVMSLIPCHEYQIDYVINGSLYAQDQYLVPCEADFQEFQKELFLNPLSLENGNVDSTVVDDVHWQILKNGVPLKQQDVIVDYINATGSVLYSELVDEKGQFKFRKLPSNSKYLFKVKSDESTLCDKLEVVLLDAAGKKIGLTTRDENCKYTYQRDETVIDTTSIIPTVTNVKVEPALYEKFYNYNMKDIERGEREFDAFVTKVAEMIKVRGWAEISIEGSASQVPTTKFVTNDRLSKFRTSDAKRRLEDALKEKGIPSPKLRYKSVNSLVQGPRYKNDFEENKAAYEKYQYIKIWAK